MSTSNQLSSFAAPSLTSEHIRPTCRRGRIQQLQIAVKYVTDDVNDDVVLDSANTVSHKATVAYNKVIMMLKTMHLSNLTRQIRFVLAGIIFFTRSQLLSVGRYCFYARCVGLFVRPSVCRPSLQNGPIYFE